MSAETPSRKAFFSVQIDQIEREEYVAKCRNSLSGGGSNSGGSSRNGASTKEKNKNANDADPAPNAIEYESIFRVKRRFPDDFVSFSKTVARGVSRVRRAENFSPEEEEEENGIVVGGGVSTAMEY